VTFNLQHTIQREYLKVRAPERRGSIISSQEELDALSRINSTRIIPSVEIILSKIELFEDHPGHQDPNPKLQPILIGTGAMRSKKNPRILS
jgi:hypothetical protein